MTNNLIQVHMHLSPYNPVSKAENHWLLPLYIQSMECVFLAS
jgi:hypothetical protein